MQLGDRVCAFVEIDPQDRASQRLHGDPAALDVEVDFTAVAANGRRTLCGLGHLTAEVSDVVFGEHRLQCASCAGAIARWAGRTGCRPPCCRTSSWMTHRSENASLRASTSRIPLGDITATIGGNSHFGSELDPGDRAAGVADHFLSGVERPHHLHQLPDRQRVLRRQRQGADVECRGHGIDHHSARARR